MTISGLTVTEGQIAGTSGGAIAARARSPCATSSSPTRPREHRRWPLRRDAAPARGRHGRGQHGATWAAASSRTTAWSPSAPSISGNTAGELRRRARHRREVPRHAARRDRHHRQRRPGRRRHHGGRPGGRADGRGRRLDDQRATTRSRAPAAARAARRGRLHAVAAARSRATSPRRPRPREHSPAASRLSRASGDAPRRRLDDLGQRGRPGRRLDPPEIAGGRERRRTSGRSTARIDDRDAQHRRGDRAAAWRWRRRTTQRGHLDHAPRASTARSSPTTPRRARRRTSTAADESRRAVASPPPSASSRRRATCPSPRRRPGRRCSGSIRSSARSRPTAGRR